MVMQDGMVIGPYRIAGTLGKGGMATVYRGYHERLDRYVAVKVMHPTFLSDDNFRSRFQREARIVARLEHPNIVQVYDYNEHDNQPYLVMKFVDGMTLKKYALKKGVTLTRTSKMLTELAGAMDYAHEKGILHRDMKPSNIIIENDTGRPYITDFGLARIAQVGASTLSHDMMLGTPYYISPEQAQGLGDLDKRTDIYSFAVILYELITGSVPFMADTPYAIVHGHIYKEPQPPGERNDDLPVAVDDVLLKALSKAPSDRYNSATELMQAFNAALLGAGVPDKSLSEPVETMSVPIHVEKLPSTQPPVRRDKQGKKVEVESSFDMGNVEWGDLGRRFESGVKNFAS
ncbi:MAG: serine/threonine protein kinase, partial [Aggregatilineales bacterium]